MSIVIWKNGWQKKYNESINDDLISPINHKHQNPVLLRWFNQKDEICGTCSMHWKGKKFVKKLDTEPQAKGS